MLGVLPSFDGTQAEAPLPSAEGEPPELARAPTCDALAASLRQCLLGKCLYADVKSVLESRADPNCSFKYKLGPKEFQGSPLTLAVKLDKPNLVRLLFASQADPESCYSMSAGRKGVHWHGPAVCGTVARGNLSMMRLLVELEANLNGRLVKFNGEPNVTLLYDASYFGHAHLVRFLLQQKGNPDLSVKFQDDMSIMRTPVHIAASLGHSEVVRVLLTAKAQISHPAACGGPPELKDAVDGCHVEVVKLLVQGKADIFSGEEGRGVDYLFEANNSVLVAAAATGLKLGGQMELSTVEDFIRFLATPDAEEIVPAAFSPCELRSWRGEKRLVWRTAYVLHGDMNVAVGPTRDHFEKQFLQVMERAAASRDNLGEEEEDHLDERFLESLLPHRFEKLPGQSQIPVELFQCLLPGLHRNPEVLWVLSCGVNDRIFDQRGARAIIQVAWKEAELAHTVALIVDTLMAVIFALLALLLHDAEMQRALWLRWPCLAVGSVILLRKVGHEVLEIMGHCMHGRLRQHILSLHFAGNAFRVASTAVSLIGLMTAWEEFQSNHALQLVFASAGFARWLWVLNALKGFESTGKPMLPILQAVPATIPFFFVIFCWFAAFIHFYYCFGLQHWWTSSVLLYKLGFLAEVAVEDMLPTSVGTENFWSLPVDVVVMVMSFSMAIILMNLLIGVLAESYNRGWEHRERLFLLERSRFVQRHFTRSSAWRRCPCARRARVADASSRDHVWYAHPKAPSSWGDISADYDSMDMNVHEKISELRRELRDALVKVSEKTQGDSRVAEVDRKVEGLQARLDEVLDMLKDRKALDPWSP
ncbi:unnamed protein product [Effrenium voratum]|uniref:Ion transport domain-containing protein n=1 Tax=Effrenium voratum TaxID=2562239 RepID=A0AA36JFK5_9DINO|nr:unnamed protein product [Effrenium voratum]CAJ1422063.1 unnamed protein product [Effrenium voratum]